MNQAIHRIRLFLCFFSGEDDFIIRKCKRNIQISFALIGLFVIVVFIGCWFSAALFMSHIFNGTRWVSVPIGIIWALLVINLYLLLLYTISPALLPVAHKVKTLEKGRVKKVIAQKAEPHNPIFSVSFLFRIAMITFLAVIIAQPYIVLIFSNSYEEGDKFAAAIRDILSHKPFSWILTAIVCIVFLLPVYFKYRVRTISNKNFEKDFEGDSAQKGLIHLREQLANPTDFKNLHQQILSTKINLIKTSDFYFQKSLIEHRIILEEYEEFKKMYCELLNERILEYDKHCWTSLMPKLSQLERADPIKHRELQDKIKRDMDDEPVQRYEYWADPPFRTHKNDEVKKLGSQEELLKQFYLQRN